MIKGAVKLHVGRRLHCEKFAVVSSAILVDVTEESCIVVVRNVLSVVSFEVRNSRIAYVNRVVEEFGRRKILTKDGTKDRFADARFAVKTNAVRLLAKDGTGTGHVGYVIEPIDDLADLVECVDGSGGSVGEAEFNACSEVVRVKLKDACAKGDVVSCSLFCQDGVVRRDLVDEAPKRALLENGGAKSLDW